MGPCVRNDDPLIFCETTIAYTQTLTHANQSPLRTQGPIRRGISFWRWSRGLFSLLRPGVMGPCVRRDDPLRACETTIAYRQTLNHVNESSLRTQGPIRRGISFWRWSRGLFSLLRPGVMGPCVRRDDPLRACETTIAYRQTLNHVNESSLRTQGPIRRGISFWRWSRGLFSLLRPGVMGPCVRRDDPLRACETTIAYRQTLNHVNESSLRTQGPIRRGISFWRWSR